MSETSSAFERAVNFAGSEAALARLLGLTPWAVSKWDKEKIPQDRCSQIQVVTGGLVTADELRPDINWDYVRAQKDTVNQLAG